MAEPWLARAELLDELGEPTETSKSVACPHDDVHEPLVPKEDRDMVLVGRELCRISNPNGIRRHSSHEPIAAKGQLLELEPCALPLRPATLAMISKRIRSITRDYLQ